MLTLQIAIGVALGILVAFYVIKNQGNFSGVITTVVIYILLLIALLANILYLYNLSVYMNLGESITKEFNEENYFVAGFTILLIIGLIVTFGAFFAYLIYGKSKTAEGNILLLIAYGIINLDICGALYWILSKVNVTESAPSLYLIGIYGTATIIRYLKDKQLE